MKKKWTGERLETFVENETTIEHLHRYSIVKPYIGNKIILDIACGEGYGSNLLSQTALKVISVDIDETTILLAKQKYCKKNLEFRIGSTSNIPLEKNSVDIVVSFETIEHHDQHQEMMKEIKRVLKPDGILFISSPEKKSEKSFNPYHIKELTNLEFKTLLQSYFKNTSYFNQKIAMGSLIIAEAHSINDFESHYGNFNELYSEKGLKNRVFNIAIASDSDFSPIGNSIFEGEEILKTQIISPYTNSKVLKFTNNIKRILKGGKNHN